MSNFAAVIFKKDHAAYIINCIFLFVSFCIPLPDWVREHLPYLKLKVWQNPTGVLNFLEKCNWRVK